jgi:hypothetical protein
MPRVFAPAMSIDMLSTEACARFVDKIQIGPGCWSWTGAGAPSYGRVGVNRRMYGAHRIAYALVHGSIAEGRVVHHRCDNPNCVRPDHLEAVPQKQNVLYGASPVGRVAQTGRCKHGHELSGDNLYISPSNKRNCRACQRQRSAASHRRKKGA